MGSVPSGISNIIILDCYFILCKNLSILTPPPHHAYVTVGQSPPHPSSRSTKILADFVLFLALVKQSSDVLEKDFCTVSIAKIRKKKNYFLS